jgi:hypothetical protein
MLKRPTAVLFLIALYATTSTAATNGPPSSGFVTLLAEKLGADPQNLVLNVPPRPDAWPGAIFTSNLRVPIRRGDPNDISLKRGQPVRVDATNAAEVGAGAGAGFWSMFGLSVGATDIADISMIFPDALIVDMEYDNLVKHIELPGPVVEAITRGQIPLIVIKSYMGTPTITMKRKSGASADAYAKMKSGIEARAQGSAGVGDSVSYGLKEPIIFAFETAQIDVDPADLVHRKLTIRLTSMPAQLFLARQTASEADAVAAQWEWVPAQEYKGNSSTYYSTYYKGFMPDPGYVYQGLPYRPLQYEPTKPPLVFSNPQ